MDNGNEFEILEDQKNVTVYLSTSTRSWVGSNSLEKTRFKFAVNISGDRTSRIVLMLSKAMSIERSFSTKAAKMKTDPNTPLHNH